MNFLKAGMHKLPEYMQLRQAVESNALPAVATGLSGIHKATIINALVQDPIKQRCFWRQMKRKHKEFVRT